MVGVTVLVLAQIISLQNGDIGCALLRTAAWQRPVSPATVPETMVSSTRKSTVASLFDISPMRLLIIWRPMNVMAIFITFFQGIDGLWNNVEKIVLSAFCVAKELKGGTFCCWTDAGLHFAQPSICKVCISKSAFTYSLRAARLLAVCSPRTPCPAPACQPGGNVGPLLVMGKFAAQEAPC